MRYSEEDVAEVYKKLEKERWSLPLPTIAGLAIVALLMVWMVLR